MVRPIMRDPLFLAGKSESATEADKQVVQDLLDTLKANQDRCVGMAANMIGEHGNHHETVCNNRQVKQEGTEGILFQTETHLGRTESGNTVCPKWQGLQQKEGEEKKRC